MVDGILITLIVATWVYWVIATVQTLQYFGPELTPNTDFTPPVSILKPLKGTDPGLYENFVTYCGQDYPEFELLFVIEDAGDPAAEVVEQLRHDFPAHDISLVVAPPEQVNRKASMLDALTRVARYEYLVVSDSDIRVGPDYLRQVVKPLADPDVGLVTCLYRGSEPLTFTARMESLHMGVTFLPSVMMARLVLGMRFAMGATVVLRTDSLDAIGGFASVADYLADDYQLGQQTADAGYTVVLSTYIVDSVLGPTTFKDQWDREVRWIHCSRVSRPLEYPGVALTFSTPIALLLLLTSGFAPVGWVFLAFSLVLRWVVAWLVTGVTENQRLRRWLFLLPLRDLMSAAVWAAGAIGRGVVWRGISYTLLSDGRLAARPPNHEHVVEDLS